MKFPSSTLAFILFGTAHLFAQTPPPSPSVAPSAPPPLAPVLLETILQRPSLWTATPPDLQADLKNLGFRWLSATQDAARSARPGVSFAGAPVNETILRFTGGKLSSATVLYYDRAASKELNRAQFEKYLADVSQKLTALTGQQPVERGRDATSAVKAEGRVWETPTTKYLLEWSFTKESLVQNIPFRAEFVRLTVQPRGSEVQPISS